MGIDYRMVNIYVDAGNNLLAIAVGESKRMVGAIVELDIVNEIRFPYSDLKLETVLKRALQQCFSRTQRLQRRKPLREIFEYKRIFKGG